MGVIRHFSSLNNNDSQLIEDIIENIIDNNVENELNENNVESNDRSYRNRQSRQNRNRRNLLRPEPTFRGLGLRGMSHKKHRRFANANLLSREYETLSDGEELNDISIYDFIPQTVSAFAQLLMEKENMKAWNDLINCTEEQQNELLFNITKDHQKSKNGVNGVNDCQLNDNVMADKRETNPGFSADQCFKRIDVDLKNMLKKKHIPLGVLASIEEEITNFFNDKPSAIYKSCLSSGYQRLLLHACCQYLDLTCLSFDNKGKRWSRVQNRNDYFSRPAIMLAKYLEMRNGNHYYRRSNSFL